MDKISLLKDFVPQVLIDNRKVYSIISLGIHELKEEECEKYYPYLKSVIEQVLSGELLKKNAKEVTSSFQKILQKQEFKK